MARPLGKSTFEPDFVAMLVDVLHKACAEVETASGQEPSEEMRDRLAKAIMVEAEKGEADPAVLKAHALNAIPGCVPATKKAS